MSRLVSAYETDFHAWALANAALLRAGRVAEADAEHIAEELESMAGKDRKELTSRLLQLLWHLLKWQYQPERAGGSWANTINIQRAEIEVLLDENPSLHAILPERFAVAYAKARRFASSETRLPSATFPDTCPFTIEQTLDPGFWPGLPSNQAPDGGR
ncbi:MAG: DUF29 domain-containing protein [Candidatus Competibacteraceae bacterium]|nr:MAG: DUF29 domain-containing protein [Candidatus Competibacteraceae bacterium]